MAIKSEHPVRDAFLRLLLVLLWYAAIFCVGLMALGVLLIFTGSLGERVATALGGSTLAKAAGFIVTFVALILVQVGLGAAIGFAYASFQQRWPDNPLERLIKWVRDGTA